MIEEAKPPEYVRIHHQVVVAVEDCIHVEAVLNIDEMWAWLPSPPPKTSRAIAKTRAPFGGTTTPRPGNHYYGSERNIFSGNLG